MKTPSLGTIVLFTDWQKTVVPAIVARISESTDTLTLFTMDPVYGSGAFDQSSTYAEIEGVKPNSWSWRPEDR